MKPWQVSTHVGEKLYYRFSDLKIDYKIPMCDIVELALIQLAKQPDDDILKEWIQLLKLRSDERSKIHKKRTVIEEDTIRPIYKSKA